MVGSLASYAAATMSLTDWEARFLRTCELKSPAELSEKQRALVDEIQQKKKPSNDRQGAGARRAAAAHSEFTRKTQKFYQRRQE